MFCKHCSQPLPPDAFFCPNCGRKTETPSGAPAETASVPTAPADGAPDEIDSGMNFALIITVLALFQCGTYINLVLGIVAILFANNANRNLETGDLDQARECAKTAKTLCTIATGVIALQILVIFFVIALMTLVYVIPFLILLTQ